jgi:hypothetical protein
MAGGLSSAVDMNSEVFERAKTPKLGFTEASWPGGFDAKVDATNVLK